MTNKDLQNTDELAEHKPFLALERPHPWMSIQTIESIGTRAFYYPEAVIVKFAFEKGMTDDDAMRMIPGAAMEKAWGYWKTEVKVNPWRKPTDGPANMNAAMQINQRIRLCLIGPQKDFDHALALYCIRRMYDCENEKNDVRLMWESRDYKGMEHLDFSPIAVRISKTNFLKAQKSG
jgi:hypothetical protein